MQVDADIKNIAPQSGQQSSARDRARTGIGQDSEPEDEEQKDEEAPVLFARANRLQKKMIKKNTTSIKKQKKT